MKTRILLALFLVLCLTLALCACGCDEGTDPSVNDSTTSTSSSDTDSETDENSDSPHTHSYGEWETIVEPTCTKPGKKQRGCTCGDVLSKLIIATGHNEEKIAGKAATCTEPGLTDGKKCTVCGDVTLEQKEIKATGHRYELGVCSSCGEKKPASQGLEFYLKRDNTYSVVGIGT